MNQMSSVPYFPLFDGRPFQYGPACALSSGTTRLLVYYPLGSGKTLAALHACRHFLDHNPSGKLIILTTLSNVESTWKKNIKMYRRFSDNVHKKAFKKAMLHNPDWWYSLQNVNVSHYNFIMNHLSEKGYTRRQLQNMSPGELMRACEDKKIKYKFKRALDRACSTDRSMKRHSMLRAIIPKGKYCLVVDECQGYINPSAVSEMVNVLAKASEVTILLSATPVHDSYKYDGLRRLLGNPRNLKKSCIWTSYSGNIPHVKDNHVNFIYMNESEWRKHKAAENARSFHNISENAYLTKSRQTCNCLSKWEAMATQIENDILGASGIVRMVVYSFFRLHGVDGFYSFLGQRWNATVEKNMLVVSLGDINVYISSRRENTLKWFNKKGPEAKILLLTSKDGVGISLKNVRWFHLMEPQWSDAEDQQAIGRSTRTNSHTEVDSIVNVYRWISIFPSKHRSLSSDQKVRAQMIEKKRRTDRLLNRMSQAGAQYLRKLLEDVTIDIPCDEPF